MRDGAQSWIIKTIFLGLLALATAGLVLMDMGNFFTGALPETTAFEIEDESFSMSQLDRLVSQTLQQNQLTLEQGISAGVVNAVINQEIERRLLAKEAHKLGIIVSDEIVADQTQALLDNFVSADTESGKNNADLRRAVFERLLMQAGLSEAQYIAMQKHDIASTLLKTTIAGHSLIPDDLKEMLLQYNAETRDAQTYHITVKDSEIPTADTETLKAFYESQKESYRVPEYRRFDVAELTLQNIQDNLDITDEMIADEYHNRIAAGDYVTAEMRLLAQASLPSKEEAEQVLSKAKELKDLRKALKEVTGSDSAYVPADKYDTSSLPETLSVPLFETQDKGLMGPFETDLGWFVLDVKDVMPASTKTLKEVRDGIDADLRYSLAADNLYDLSYALEDAINAGDSLETVAKEMNLKVTHVGFVDAAGNAENSKEKGFTDDVMPASTEVLDSVFQTEAGLPTPLLENATGDFLIAHVHETKASYIPDFEDIQKEVQKDWMEQERARIAREKAEEFMTLVAKDQKRPNFKTHNNVHRLTYAGDLSKQQLNTLAVTALFQLDKKGEMTSIPYKNGQLVIRYNGSSLDLPEKESTAMLELKGSISRSYDETLLEDYFAALKSDLDITINNEAIAEFYANRLGQNN